MPSGISDQYFVKLRELMDAPRAQWACNFADYRHMGLDKLLAPRVLYCPICQGLSGVSEIHINLEAKPEFARLVLDCDHQVVLCPDDDATHGAVVGADFFNLK